VTVAPDAPAIIYFDTVLSVRETDEMASALAAALADKDIGRGDRVGIHLQNVPQYALSLLALWKLGAVALLLNPMYLGRELRTLVADAEPKGIIATDSDVERVQDSVADTTVRWVLGTSNQALQTRNDPRAFTSDATHPISRDGDLMTLIESFRGRVPEPATVAGDDIAFLTYTSGTTGPPKGAMNTHANVLAVITSFARFADLGSGEVVLALAPLFHITGAVVIAALALTENAALVFAGRFQPEFALEATREHAVTYTVASITAYNAMMNYPGATAEHFASIKTLFSGGAPVPPSTIAQFQERFGHYIHNAYGMTETSSGVVAVPPGVEAPVDKATGTLSIGVPLPGVHAEIVDELDRRLAPGEQGELVLSGPQMVPAYWRNPEATEATMPGGRLHTGDGAIMDAEGWLYIVDRLKDQINVSGYKVWPREVEDCLYEHPAVFEAAVVGAPDDYQGESVLAYVSLKDGQTVANGELSAFTRARLAPYKSPKTVYVVDELPKTQTGKIRRKALRDGGFSATA
jgi:long-chain acyl-CoA synthetase